MRIEEKTIVIRNLEIDEKDFKGFVKYLNSFYGVKGVYPNKFGKDLQPRDILKAIDKVAKARPKHEWDWDSLDRELVRDELINMKVFDYPTQESAIKEISEVGALYEERITEADVVGKTIFSDGKGKLFFGYYKTDDGVTFVDYKTWKGLSFKDVSKGDTNKERVIKAILKGQKQFNKKVEFNMWSKQKKRTFEETMDWFIQNGWINNINKGGIKESVESVNEGQLNVGDTITVQAGTTLQKMNVLDDKWKVIKKDNSTYTLQKVGSSMKVRHLQSKVDYLIARPGQSQLPFIVESVNESASKEAMGIAGFTGTRGSAVEDFITKNELNGKKLFNFIRKGSLKDRMDFVTALAGNPGNPIQKKVIKMFGESVNEAKTYTPKQVKQALEKMVKQLKVKWKQKGGYENFGQRELSKFKDTFGYNPYGSSDEREISDLIDSFEDWAMDYSG